MSKKSTVTPRGESSEITGKSPAGSPHAIEARPRGNGRVRKRVSANGVRDFDVDLMLHRFAKLL
jgi:hypothetical protein